MLILEIKEIMTKIQNINSNFSKRTQEALEQALIDALQLREVIDKDKARYSKEISQFPHLDGGLNAQIYNIMKLLKQYDDMIPYLEKTLEYLDNKNNPTLWRHLGLLYLVKEENLEKAIEAWEKALQLNPTLAQKYSGLNIVYVYKSLIKQGKKPTWKIESADLESGHFSVVLK